MCKFKYLIYIFNNYVDKNPSLKYNTRNNGDKYLYLDNTNNINIMYLELTKEYNYLYFDNYNFSFDNIKINYNNRKLKFRPGHKLYSMDNIDFVLISYARLHHEDIDKQIPEKISIDFDNETFIFTIEK